MLKILIVDHSESVRKYLSRHLGELAQVVTCDTCDSVLDQVYSLEPDVIMLDMMLTGQDALEILQVLCTSGRKTLVLATMDYLSDFIRVSLERLNVGYVMNRPYKMTTLTARLREMILFAQSCEDAWCSDEERINGLLFALGMHANKSGYPCLQTALGIVLNNPGISMTKDLYPQVAEICGGTDKRVEKAIRNTIQQAWECRDRSIWRCYFSADESGKDKCPSNGAFLDRLAACLRMEKKVV